jgi:hypothetical protein
MGDSDLREKLKHLEEKERALKLERQVREKESSVRSLEREVHPSKKQRIAGIGKKVGKAAYGYLEGFDNQPRAYKKRTMKYKKKSGPKRKKRSSSYYSGWGF